MLNSLIKEILKNKDFHEVLNDIVLEFVASKSEEDLAKFLFSNKGKYYFKAVSAISEDVGWDIDEVRLDTLVYRVLLKEIYDKLES